MARLIPPPSASQSLDVLVLGRAGMDLYPLPHGTKTADADTFHSDLGGSAGNIAVALARHDVRVGLIAPISDDPVGRFVSNKLAHYGVEHLTPTPLASSVRTSLALAESRSDNCEVVIYRNQAADFMLGEQTFALESIDRAPVLIVTGTALAQEPSRTTTLAAMARASFVILDLDYRAYSWGDRQDTADTYARACALADMVVGNDEEFDMIAPSRGQAWAQQHAKTQDSLVIYKMGARGSKSFWGTSHFDTGIYAVDMLKPFGAGDAFMGGLVAALLKGHDAPSAVDMGSACAAIVVSTMGCASAMPTTAQVIDFIAARKGA